MVVRFLAPLASGTGFAMSFLKLHHFKENAMKFETLMLQTLFSACLLVCVLTFGAMLTSHPSSSMAAAAHRTVAASAMR